ncbi:hypothetical protein WDW89_02840 [Deltaproteobacteria bacterium TL4]
MAKKIEEEPGCAINEITDCLGGCITESLIGDKTCHSSLNCSLFNYDEGDCAQDTTTQECTPNETANVPCTVLNGNGQRTKTCKSDESWSELGACQITSCDNGFTASGSTCVADVTTVKECTANAKEVVSCTIQNGTGERSKTCDNDGIWTDFGACQIISCNEGYEFEGNSCVIKKVTEISSSECNDTYCLTLSPPIVKLTKNGQVGFKARVTDKATENLLINDLSQEDFIEVDWKSSDDDIVKIDDRGEISKLSSGPASITATMSFQGTTLQASVQVGESFSDIQSIAISPIRLSLDVEGTRIFNVYATDTRGAPTSLDCKDGLKWEFDDRYVSKQSSNTESALFKGVKKGYTLLNVSCDEIYATPATIEVKPPVTIPH